MTGLSIVAARCGLAPAGAETQSGSQLSRKQPARREWLNTPLCLYRPGVHRKIEDNKRMERRKIFLTAEWTNLLMLNYAVDPSILARFVPASTTLDAFDGRTYLSLVGFQFNRTKLCGLAVPFHQRFEEVNLRFYVKQHAKRGVVFIRELVPKNAVAALARLAFNENYSCVPMSHRIESGPGRAVVKAEYAWRVGPDRCLMQIETEGESFLPPEGSVSQFITEHYWGYAAQPNGGCVEYEVQHPRWKVWQAKQAGFSGNAGGLYGDGIAQILTQTPDSAFLAEGSPVTVFKGTRIA
jgi:uncharacterized protein